MYRVWDMRENLPHGCDSTRPKDEEGLHQVSGGLSDLSFVQDVLPCGCHHHFTGEVYSGCGFLGVA